jgi:hypothetical protein
MSKITFNRYTLEEINCRKAPSDLVQIFSYGDTAEQSISNCSGGADKWRLISTDCVEYPYSDKYIEIAANLSDITKTEWIASPTCDDEARCHWLLTRKDGLSLAINSIGASDDKFIINPALQGSLFSWRCLADKINISKKKSSATIAAEIVRRLLNAAEKLLSDFSDFLEEESKKFVEIDDRVKAFNAVRLAIDTGSKPYTQRDVERSNFEKHTDWGFVYILKMRDGNEPKASVSILSCSINQAVLIAKIMKGE